MKNYVLSYFLLIFLCLGAEMNAQTISGKYKRKVDKILDGNVFGKYDNFGLDITYSTPSAFKAKYYGLKNDSYFVGEVFNNKIVKIYQHDKNSYHAVYAGTIVESGNKITGTWYDSKGNSGDFELVKEETLSAPVKKPTNGGY